jgi:hypothetical protein
MLAGPEYATPSVPEHTTFVPVIEQVGLELTVATVEPAAEEQPLTVTVTL